MPPRDLERFRDSQPLGGDWFAVLNGRVPDGVIERVIKNGRPPDRGPGRYSVPRALQAIEEERDRGVGQGWKQPSGPPRGTKMRHFGGR